MSTATIHDVARKAKVSAGTVSRVLRRHPSVSSENLERVVHAIEALNYSYSPRKRRSEMSDGNPLAGKNVLMLFLGDERSIISLPAVASVVRGVQSASDAAEADLTVIEVPSADHVPKVMSRKVFHGVILKGAFGGDLASATHPELLARLRALPSVWVLGRAGEWGDVVQANDMRIGAMAADYLLERGHRRLAFVDPRPLHNLMRKSKGGRGEALQAQDAARFSSSRRRQSSFSFFAREGGADVKAYLGEPGSWPFPNPVVDRIEMVQGVIDKLLAERQPPTAIFTPLDSIGATVARALSARGLQAGRDISLMSCNNEQLLFMGIHPSLTTIDIHADEIGRRAVDQLAWRLMHDRDPMCEIAVEPTLVEGESVVELT